MIASTAPKAEVLVRRVGTRQIVKRIPVSPLSERRMAKLVRGLELNMSDDYFVDDGPARKALGLDKAVSE